MLFKRAPLTVCAPQTEGEEDAARRCVRIPQTPQDHQTSNTPQTGAPIIGTTSTDGSNCLSMSHNVISHRFLRYRRERGPLQSHRRVQISPNVSINAQWRAVTAQNGSQYILVHKESLISHVSMVWSNQAPIACLYPGKVALHKRIRHPRPPVTGAIDPVRLERKWTN